MPYDIGMTAKEAKDATLRVETYRTYRNNVLEMVHKKIVEAVKDGRFSAWINLNASGYSSSEINKRMTHVAVALRDEGYSVETGVSNCTYSLNIRWD